MIPTITASLLATIAKSSSTTFRENKQLITLFGLVSNVSSSILIVLINKWLYSHVGFPNMTLTVIHFATTFACLHLCQSLGVFCVKHVPLRSVLPLASSFCGFVVLTNLSLESNTVGTYQVAKVLTTPVILVIQFLYYGKPVKTKIALTLLPITLGVIINFYYDIKFNILGTFYAIAGVLVTSVYQVLVGEKQKELQTNSMQLLYYQAPISTLMLLCIVPYFEPLSELTSRAWNWLEVMGVLLSSLVAFLVNLTIFWVIGNTSAVTYNMAGHLKFCLILAGGYFIFHDPLSLNQLAGMLLTIGGVLLYTHFKLKEESEKKRPVLGIKS